MEIAGSRLHYCLYRGSGPASGWISMKPLGFCLMKMPDCWQGAGAGAGSVGGGGGGGCGSDGGSCCHCECDFKVVIVS